MKDLIDILIELSKSELVKNNISQIIILAIIFALLSGGITYFIADKFIFLLKTMELNNEILRLKEVEKEKEEVEKQNEQLINENEDLRNKIKKYKFFESALEESDDLDDKGIIEFFKKKNRKKE